MRIPGQLLYGWFRQGVRNPATRQWVILCVFVYLLSPIDIIPSVLPGIGELDDVFLLGLLLVELAQVWFLKLDQAPPEKATPKDAAKNPSFEVIDVVAIEES